MRTTQNTKTISLNNTTYTVKGELPNGAFYLEGPRGGNAHLAKPANGVYVFTSIKGGAAIYEAGVLRTATREELAA